MTSRQQPTEPFPINVVIVGGGMITADQLLPSAYQLQRLGIVDQIIVANRHVNTLKQLANNQNIRTAFPSQSFTAIPSLESADDAFDPDAALKAIDALRPRQAVILALPDQVHYPMLKEALNRDQHVLCVKPLVRKYSENVEVDALARSRGLFVGVEYHKRFDRRTLIAKRHYESGSLGEFKLGDARLIEPYYYRDSNFQKWFVCDQTDPFVYVGCHYVDMVYFITGLKPTAISLSGVRDKFPNGNEAYMWSNGRVIFENGAILSVNNGLGYPDEGAGANDQGITMYCDGGERGCVLEHDDQYRGTSHSSLPEQGAGKAFRYVNPDYFNYVGWEGEGLLPVGYGYDSVAANIRAIHQIENTTAGLDRDIAKSRRLQMIKRIDEQGFIATPANSYVNELVTEAARISIQNDGVFVDIAYGKPPLVSMRR